MNHVKITSSDGLQHVVEIDGHPIQNSLTSLNYSVDARDRMPVLDLRLILRGAPLVDGRAVVRLDPETAEALTAMGWTPPPEDNGERT